MKKTIIFIRLLLLVFIFLYLGISIYYNKTNTALRYFKYISNIDSTKIYQSMNIIDDEFVNESNFESILVNQKLSNDYKIKEVKEEQDKVLIQYISANENIIKTYEIFLKKGNNLIKKWNLDDKMFVVNDYKIRIPKKYEAFLDDINIEKYMVEKTETMITYNIPNIFLGSHYLKLVSSEKQINIELNITDSIQTYEYKETVSKRLIEITFSEFLDLYNSNTPQIIIIGSSYCSHCTKFKPIMEETSYKYDKNVYLLDLAALTEDDYIEFKSIKYISDNFSGTPTTILVKSGEVIYDIIGYTTYVDTIFKKIK